MKGDKVKPFYLNRKSDPTGTSGTGLVAMGAVFPSGKVYIEWVASNHVSWGIFNNIDDVTLIHGHEGSTEVVMGNPYEKKGKRK